MSDRNVDIAVIGAGIVGIACAYYLARSNPAARIAIVDPNAPMSLTSAASGENYRNWWPHPVMTAFTDYSIDLLEEFARQHDNRIHMTRRGYALATRQAKPDQLLDVIRWIGTDRLMYSSDYPHPEGGTKPIFHFTESLKGKSDDVANRFFAGNMRELLTGTA